MKRRGSAMIITLLAVTALVAIVATAATQSKTAYTEIRNRMEFERARLAAEAAAQYAMSVLASQSTQQTLLTDAWATLGSNGATEYTLPTASFRFQVIDACSKIGLNTATEDHLASLPLTQEQIDCLLDWRETDTTPRSDGAKDDYYHSLTVPYNAKLGPLTTFTELMDVKAFTAADLYFPQSVSATGSNYVASNAILDDVATVGSQDSALNAQGTAKTSINSATQQQLQSAGISQNVAQQIVSRRPITGYATIGDAMNVPGMDLNTAGRLADAFTIAANGVERDHVDLNTASRTVLLTFPNATSGMVDDIISRQSNGISAISDLTSVSGMTLPAFEDFADECCVNSSMFVVRVIGKAGSVEAPFLVWVKLGGTTPVIDHIEQPPFADMATRWGWNDVSETVDLEGSNS